MSKTMTLIGDVLSNGEVPTQIQAAIDNPLAAATWLVFTVVAWYVTIYLGKKGWAATAWTYDKIADRFRTPPPPPVSDRTQQLLTLLSTNKEGALGRWLTNDLPNRTQCTTPANSIFRIAFDPNKCLNFTIDGVDVTRNLPATEINMITGAGEKLINALSEMVIAKKMGMVNAVTANAVPVGKEAFDATSGATLMAPALSIVLGNAQGTWTPGKNTSAGITLPAGDYAVFVVVDVKCQNGLRLRSLVRVLQGTSADAAASITATVDGKPAETVILYKGGYDHASQRKMFDTVKQG